MPNRHFCVLAEWNLLREFYSYFEYLWSNAISHQKSYVGI